MSDPAQRRTTAKRVARAYCIVAGGEFCKLIAARILVWADGVS